MLTKTVSRTVQVLIIVGVLTVGNDARGAGEVTVDWGHITILSAGWTEDTMAVFHSQPFKNPAGCPVTGGGYATDPAAPGHNLFHTVALSALMNKRDTQILLAGPPQTTGCIYGKPKIIGITLR